ncbi:hypothetical protein M514_17521 [Trichuris suis]|uniref:Uncharacterized protein n=1 Tax=Trichuris suis TaxID=68888 RepID=A0A085NLU1_9BILA|nr:hypothetical protein M514_17521 [Trichuris suis]
MHATEKLIPISGRLEAAQTVTIVPPRPVKWQSKKRRHLFQRVELYPFPQVCLLRRNSKGYTECMVASFTVRVISLKGEEKINDCGIRRKQQRRIHPMSTERVNMYKRFRHIAVY